MRQDSKKKKQEKKETKDEIQINQNLTWSIDSIDGLGILDIKFSEELNTNYSEPFMN